MDLLGLPDIFTTDTSATRVRAVPMYSFSMDTLEGLNKIRARNRPTIGILPSALPWIKKSLKKNEFLSGSFLTSRYKRSKWNTNSTQVQMDKQMGKTDSPKMFDKYTFAVPYSDHSNYAELEDFIKLVKPNSLKGIVSSSSCYIEPMYYFGRLCTGSNQPLRQLHSRSKLQGSSNIEKDNLEFDLNMSKERYKMNEGGKRVVIISPETSVEDDNVELDETSSEEDNVELDETSFEHDDYVELDETSCEEDNVELDETSFEDDELDRNRSKNMFEMKENGKRVATVSPETSVRDDNVELGENRRKVLNVKLSGFRMRRLRKHRVAKIPEYVEEDYEASSMMCTCEDGHWFCSPCCKV